jgi:hypothetical protein
MNTPWLIQRATIKQPLAYHADRLSRVVEFDYMGSSEFEFGALPASFRRLQQQESNWKIRYIAEIEKEDADTSLRVFSALNDAEFEIYKGYLKRLRGLDGEPLQLKERTEFSLTEVKQHARRIEEERLRNMTSRRRGQRGYTPRPLADFWWDIENDVMFSFDVGFMLNITDYVKASLTYMDEKK